MSRFLLCLALLLVAGAAMSADDIRFSQTKDLNSVYSFSAPATPSEWKSRAAELRARLLLSAGLYPMPKPAPLNSKFVDRKERDGYSVERVVFESYPGLYVSGNLYRPLGKKGPFPAVLNPHGHTSNGRLAQSSLFASQGRCISQAKLGMVALSYDMLGYNDSFQLDHRFASNDKPEDRALAIWGISPMGIQLYNSIRAVDFLQSLPDVDDSRIGCTGESGGGTQTFLLAAVDDRVKASAPVNMVSGQMQGGCICENGPGLRVGTNNMEIAALAAPRPQLLVSCTNDWTVNTPLVEYPAVRSAYKLLKAEDKIGYVQFEADHNYNLASREAVYPFLLKSFGMKAEGGAEEPNYQVETDADLLVHPELIYADALKGSALVDKLRHQASARVLSLKPRDRQSVKALQQQTAPMFRTALAVEIPGEGSVVLYSPSSVHNAGSAKVRQFALGRKDVGDGVRAIYFWPASGAIKGRVLLTGDGGVDGFAPGGNPGDLASALVQQGMAVLAIDTFKPGSRPAVQYFDTYNSTDTAEAVQDVLTAWGYLRQLGKEPVTLIGTGKGGLWTILSVGAASGLWAPAGVVADMNSLDSADDAQLVDLAYVPCLRLAGDFRAAAALACPARLLLHNTGSAFDDSWAKQAYAKTGNIERLQISQGKLGDSEIVEWLKVEG